MITNQNPVLSRTGLVVHYERNMSEMNARKKTNVEASTEHSTAATTAKHPWIQNSTVTELQEKVQQISEHCAAASACERKGNPCTYPWLQQCNSIMSLLNTIDYI